MGVIYNVPIPCSVILAFKALFVFGPHLAMLRTGSGIQRSLQACEITGPYRKPGIKPRSTACKSYPLYYFSRPTFKFFDWFNKENMKDVK